MEGESMVLLEVSLMKFILRISNEIKWKVKMVLLQVPLLKVILCISNEMKRKDESGVTLSIIVEVCSSDIQGD